MSDMRPLSKDDPRMKAWDAYKATADYRNTRTWAQQEGHVDGSLWAAFLEGWEAATASTAPSAGAAAGDGGGTSMLEGDAFNRRLERLYDDAFERGLKEFGYGLRDALARIRELEAQQQWRPIETAPKMQAVLLFAVTSLDPPNWKMGTGVFSTGHNAWEWEGRVLKPYDHQPTHWQSLSAPPKEQPSSHPRSGSDTAEGR